MNAPTPIADQLRDSFLLVRPRVTGDARLLAEALIEAWDRARAARPGIAVSPGDFAAHLARHVEKETAQLPAALRALRSAELLLALGCARQDASALAAFEAEFLPPALGSVRRIDPSAAFVDDVAQQVRERLLTGTGAAPARILEFAGRGPLEGWVRAVAVRTALNARRGRQELPVPDSGEDDSGSPSASDPELRWIKAHYRADFNAAFREAIAALQPRERNLLRMSLLEGWSIDRIAPVYQAGRSTVARWLASAREHLLAETRARFVARLGASASEVDSLMGLVRSELEVSFRAFAEPKE